METSSLCQMTLAVRCGRPQTVTIWFQSKGGMRWCEGTCALHMLPRIEQVLAQGDTHLSSDAIVPPAPSVAQKRSRRKKATP